MTSDFTYLPLPDPQPLFIREVDIETAFIEKLRALKYTERPDIRDRASLEANFRKKFEALNRVRLTDAEFQRLLEELTIPDVFTAARVLREKNDFTRDDGTPLAYTLVNIKDWCKNDFEVVQQLRINTDYSHHRYDVLLLINGVPVVQIELKTLGVNPRRAMEQIVEYKNDPGNGYTRTLLCFVQLFIVSNRTDTIYFSNNNARHFAFNADERFLPVYRWADRDNKPITHLDDFAEENIFIWCFFLAIVQLAMDDDGTGPYRWVKYIYIDDPISSLDEHNAIAVANHLAQLLKKEDSRLKTVVSTHHTLFFNVLHNELGNANKYFLSRAEAAGSYMMQKTGDTPFFHHVAVLVALYEAEQSGRLFTHHFNMLRAVLEKTASFHGYPNFSACIKQDANDEDGILHTRLINILSHGNYSLYEPQEMLAENKRYFRKILRGFIERYPFNPTLFPVAAPASAPGAEA